MGTKTDRPKPVPVEAWPLDGPDWRWVRAQRGAADSSIVAGEDAWVRQAADFLALRPRSEEASRQKYPRVTAAQTLWRNEASQRAVVLMTLAGCPAEDIAARLNVVKDVVRWTQALFFDVVERRHATDWIYLTVIRPRSASLRPDHVSECWAALHGGQQVAKVILDGDQEMILPPPHRLEAREAKLALKTMTALKMPLGEKELLKYLKLTAQIQRDKDRLELDRQKFAQACAEVGRRAVRAADAKQRRTERELRKKLLRRRLADAIAADERAAAARSAGSPLNGLAWATASAVAQGRPSGAGEPGRPPGAKRRRSAPAARRGVPVGSA